MAQQARQDYREQLRDHRKGMILKADGAGRGLAAIARRVRSEYLDAQWAASLSGLSSLESSPSLMPPVERSNLAMSVRRHMAVGLTGEVVAGRLYEGSLALIRARQREVYEADQGGMAKIVDAATNPAWSIVATVTEQEVQDLFRLPVNGVDLPDALAAAAARWRDEFRARMVRSLTAGPWDWSTGLQRAVQSLSGTFDSWAKDAGRIAYAAAVVALNESARQFKAAFMPPDRQGLVLAPGVN